MERSRQFNQEQKLVILESAKEVGIREASRIAGVHYTTVYEWRNRLEALGRDGFLSYCSESRGRGIKQVTEVQEKAVLDTWERYPGFGPSQMKNPLRGQGVTVSTRTMHRIMEANGSRGNRKKREKETSQRFEALRPLELAQRDILEFFINKQKVYLLLLLGKSILEKIVSVYIAMRNRLPPLGDRQSLEEILSHPASPEARQQMGDHYKKRAQKQDDPDRRQKLDRLDWLISYHSLNIDEPSLKRAQTCIGYHDQEAIAKSEEAFLASVRRDQNRRPLPYFFGISSVSKKRWMSRSLKIIATNVTMSSR